MSAHLTLVYGLVTVALVVVIAGVARATWRERPPWPDVAALALLGLGAIGLRLSVPVGLMEQNFRTGAVFLGVNPGGWHYGVAQPWIWRLLIGPWLDVGLPALLDTQALLGGLVAPALVVLARTAGLDRTTSMLAGVLLALTPVHVRFSHTDAQGIPETLALCVGLTAWIRHARSPSWGAALVGASAVGLAAVSRPEALLLVPLVPLAVGAAGLRWPWRDRRTWVAVAWMVLVVGVHVAGILVWNGPASLKRAGISGLPSPLVNGPRHYVGLDATFTSPVVIAATVAGLLLGPGTWRQRLAWGALAATTGAFVLDPMWSAAGRDLPTFTRHQLRSLPFFAILAAMGATGVGRRLGAWSRAGALAVPAGVVVGALVQLPWVWAHYTMHDELAFVMRQIPRIPPGCTVVTWYPPLDQGLTVSWELSDIARRHHRWVFLDRGEQPPETGCVRWYRPGNCAATTGGAPPDATAPCRTFEATHALRPIAEAHLPVRSWQYEVYTEDPVRVGIYEVLGRNPSVGPFSEASTGPAGAPAPAPAAPAGP
jgi:hypothetical protein